jgi:hypothetical protein
MLMTAYPLSIRCFPACSNSRVSKATDKAPAETKWVREEGTFVSIRVGVAVVTDKSKRREPDEEAEFPVTFERKG